MTKDRLEQIKRVWYASVERRDHILELWLALEQAWAERDRLGVELREVRIELEQVEAERDEAVKEGRRLTSLLEQAETGRESYKAEVVTLKAKIAELQEFGL